MTNISGFVTDVGLVGSHGRLIVQAVEFYGDGDEVVVPSPVTFPISSGVVSANVSPGAARLTIHVGSSRRDWFVNIPESDVGLGDLIETFTEYEPPVVSAAIAARDAAKQARDEAVASASAADVSAGDASSAASAASSSASDASSSATAAAGSAQDAAASASAASTARAGAESARDGAQAAAQVVTENLDVIEAAPGHAADAAAARQGAESARDAAEGHASSTEGSAQSAASSASDAAGSASAAEGSKSAAASSASAAAGSATAAEGSASDAAGAVVDARAARDAAEGHASSAAGSASAASQSALEADGHAGRAEAAANEFGLTASSSTLAPGAAATVAVSGEGPAYNLSFGVPQGPKGDKGDEGEISQAQLDAAVASLVDGAPEALDTLTELAAALGDDPNFAATVSTQIGKRALIDGAPAAYDSLGKLVTALQNHELGGSTDASLLTGALTDQVDATQAMVDVSLVHFGGPESVTDTVAGWVAAIYSGLAEALDGLSGKSDLGHTHTKSEVGLGNVDNTADVDKPVSTATQQALNSKADQADLDDKIRLVTQFPTNPEPGILYLTAEE